MPLHHAVASFAANPWNLWANLTWRLPRTVSPHPYCFVMGTPRSGTTLLKSILCAHPALAGADYEMTCIFHHRDIFTTRFQGIPPERSDALLRQSRDLVDFYDRFTRAALEGSQAAMFVDKIYRTDGFLIRLVLKHFPNAKIIYISRDGRDCYCSSLEVAEIPQKKSLLRFARYWAGNERMRRAYATHPRFHHLRYEDLAAHPEIEAPKFMDFLGLPFDPEQIRSDHYSQTTTLRERRLHCNLNQPIGTRSVGRHQGQLSPEQEMLFLSVAGPCLQELGYDTSVPTRAYSSGSRPVASL